MFTQWHNLHFCSHQTCCIRNKFTVSFNPFILCMLRWSGVFAHLIFIDNIHYPVNSYPWACRCSKCRNIARVLVLKNHQSWQTSFNFICSKFSQNQALNASASCDWLFGFCGVFLIALWSMNIPSIITLQFSIQSGTCHPAAFQKWMVFILQAKFTHIL